MNKYIPNNKYLLSVDSIMVATCKKKEKNDLYT